MGTFFIMSLTHHGPIQRQALLQFLYVITVKSLITINQTKSRGNPFFPNESGLWERLTNNRENTESKMTCSTTNFIIQRPNIIFEGDEEWYYVKKERSNIKSSSALLAIVDIHIPKEMEFPEMELPCPWQIETKHVSILKE